MMYNWSKILNKFPWARVAVMNRIGREVYLFDTKEVEKIAGGWQGHGSNHPWESMTNILLTPERPSQEDSYEEIPEIYLTSLEGE